MSREKQIEEMAKAMCGNGMANGNCAMDDEPCNLECVYGCCAERLYAAGYRKQEWISVEDRLPEPFVSVLVYMPDEIPHPTVREGFINKRGEWYAGGFDRLPDEVVSWMKMPEAPKMKGGK